MIECQPSRIDFFKSADSIEFVDNQVAFSV